MREGTTKLLAACKHAKQALEAAKSLLTSNERMQAYMLELQKRRSHEQQMKKSSKTLVFLFQIENIQICIDVAIFNSLKL